MSRFDCSTLPIEATSPTGFGELIDHRLMKPVAGDHRDVPMKSEAAVYGKLGVTRAYHLLRRIDRSLQTVDVGGSAPLGGEQCSASFDVNPEVVILVEVSDVVDLRQARGAVG